MSDAPRVALTFDAEHPDRPHHGEHTAWVLDELARLEVPATVFLQGRWVEAFPDLASRVAAEGHLVGNHSFYHARMPLLTDAGFAEDVHEAQRVILDTTGVDPRPWLRFPFGGGADDPGLQMRLAALGYRHVGWDVEVNEWDPGRTAAEVAARAVDGALAHGDGAIILLHTWPDPVAPGLSRIVEGLRERGQRFVRVDELDLSDDLSPVASPRPPLAAATG
ncbi:MAG TPA: polysaccharide deacetylase family protein [Candidatus Limnocylindria bacterium]|nr:polysaccharide deacetylase family protein [Candidatus Limnocylindria bacterium]